ncbi:MAG TPA: hypothetical protein VGE50_10615 [Gammaproteobacteria bacterium]
MTSASLLSALRSQLGTEVIHQGVHCRLLEVLDDGPQLILQDSEDHTMIQENQYGGLWRRVPQVYTVPVFTAGSCELHPQFVALKLAIPLK